MPGSPTTTERDQVAEAPAGFAAATRPATTVLLVSVAAIATASALVARPHPTASPTADIVVTAMVSVALVAMAAGAGPRAWFAAAAVTVLGATGWPLLLAASTVGASAWLWRSPRPRPHPLFGAIVGAALVHVVVRMPTGRTGPNLLIGVAVLIILGASANRGASARTRERARRAGVFAGVVVASATLGFIVALVLARQDVLRGIDRADEGLDAARDGEGDDAARLLGDAGRSFAAAHDQLDVWWTQPARWVPGLGPHAHALEVLADEGAQLATASAQSARDARIDELRVSDGQLDLDQVRALGPPLAEVQDALAAAAGGVAQAESPWLIAPISDRLEGFADDILTATDEATTASQAVAVLPALLGGEGERRYFIAFGTPSETRDLGGFMGAYAILRADDGALELQTTGRVRNLNLLFRRGQLTDPSVFPEHFLALLPQRFWQNVTGTPDFPTTAEAIRQLWRPPAAPLDGVLYLDPQALASMLELTGPIRLDGYDTPLTVDTAGDFLERIQYIEFPEDDRHDFLVDAASTVFERLTSGELPPPRELADALTPAARQRRLLFNAVRPEEQALFERLDLDGALPPVDGDFLSVRASNRGRSKIDAFMHRTITYDVQADPATGAVRSTVTVEIRNDAPATALPYPMIGNHLDRPTGTNSTTVSVYTPLSLVDVLIDGEPASRAVHQEHGRNRFSALVDIPPRGSQTVTFELEGTLDLRDGYHLDVVPQPLVHPDELVFRLQAPDGWVVDGRTSARTVLEEDERLDASFFSFG